MLRALKLIVLLLCCGLILSPPARAADTSFNLVTSPLPINLSAVPGSTLTTDIRVKNGSTHGERLKVNLMKFSAYGEGGKPAIQDRGPGDDYFDWVSFSPQTFDAPPNVWQNVRMTIKLPRSAAFGYYYAVVFSRAGAPQKPTGRENVLLGSAAVLVLVDAKVANAQRSAKIDTFSADKHVYEFLPASFNVKVHNSGNVHLIPTGNIFIKRGNNTVATLNVNDARGNVLPNSNRIFKAKWTDGWPAYVDKQAGGRLLMDEKGNPITQLSWEAAKISKLRFGHYQAHVLLAYDNGKKDVPLEAVLSFWVIPWRVILLAIAIPVIPALIVYLLMKRRFKHLTVAKK